MDDRPAKFIIFNTKFLVYNTQFLVCNTRFLVFNLVQNASFSHQVVQ